MMDIGKDLQNAYEEGYKQGQEDRPKGKWIDEDGTYYANCSKCGYQMDTHVERGYFRYCPNCGSDNRERSEEIQGLEYAENILDSILREQEVGEE